MSSINSLLSKGMSSVVNDLKINFSEIDCIADELGKYQDALSTIRSEILGIKTMIRDSTGDAVDAANETIRYFERMTNILHEEITLVRGLFMGYARAMTSIIAPMNHHQMMRVDSDDVYQKFNDIGVCLDSLNSMSNRIVKSDYASSRDVAERQKLRYNYDKLINAQNYYKSRIIEWDAYLERLWKVYEEKILEFQKEDTTHANNAKELLEQRFDSWKSSWESLGLDSAPYKPDITVEGIDALIDHINNGARKTGGGQGLSGSPPNSQVGTEGSWNVPSFPGSVGDTDTEIGAPEDINETGDVPDNLDDTDNSTGIPDDQEGTGDADDVPVDIDDSGNIVDIPDEDDDPGNTSDIPGDIGNPGDDTGISDDIGDLGDDTDIPGDLGDPGDIADIPDDIENPGDIGDIPGEIGDTEDGADIPDDLGDAGSTASMPDSVRGVER